MPTFATLLVPIPLAVVLAHVVWTDLAERRIANRAVAAVLALLPLQLLATGRPDPWWSGPLAAALVLAVGLPAWRAGLLGGGDVKLAAALAALAGVANLAGLLLVTALAGGLLAAGFLLAVRLGPLLAPLAARLLPLPLAARLGGGLLAGPAGAAPTVPYGLALAAGGLWWALTLIRLTSE